MSGYLDFIVKSADEFKDFVLEDPNDFNDVQQLQAKCTPKLLLRRWSKQEFRSTLFHRIIVLKDNLTK
jgi:hypothetical protein